MWTPLRFYLNDFFWAGNDKLFTPEEKIILSQKLK